VTGAYSFRCQYSSTEALAARLNQVCPWKWGVGDSHWYGDYCVAKPWPGVRIRIIDFPKHDGQGWVYDSDIRMHWMERSPVTEEEIDKAYRAVLGEIPAEEITEIEPFD
jgi:hypothetical protein